MVRTAVPRSRPSEYEEANASIVTAHNADQIISVVAVHAPGRHAAVAVARAVVSDALKHQVPAPSQHAGEVRRAAAAPRTSAA